jgi:DNA-binding NtrC family response regulator
MLTDAQVLPFTAAQAPRPEAERQTVAAFRLLAGDSPVATQLRAQVQRVAPYFRTALLCGEQGCGDAEVARALHRLSPVGGLRLAVLNAAEAEQRFARLGRMPHPLPVEGMLYLPEAGKLSRVAQLGLLAHLRGAGRLPTRVVAFAGQGLRPLVSAGAFSAELAALLESLRLMLPPLRERAQDLPLLLEHVASQLAAEADGCPPQFSAGFLEAAARLTWPGNLTQMYAVVRRLLERGSSELLQASDLSAALEALAETQTGMSAGPRLVRLEQVAQEHIRAVLIGCGGNKLRAAEVLGISRSTLYRMLETTGYQHDWQMAG